MAAVFGRRRGGARGERVRSRLRLGERVGADHRAARELGQIARLLLRRAEVDERQRADRRVRAERSAERRVHGDLLADIRRADQVEAEAAVGRRNLESQQIEIARLLHQPAGELPIVVVEALDDRQHFLLHELGGRPSEQPLFLGEILADEHFVGRGGGSEELSARGGRVSLCHDC